MLLVSCWLPSVYQTLVCELEDFLIPEFGVVNPATGSSFLEWSREMLTSNGGINHGCLGWTCRYLEGPNDCWKHSWILLEAIPNYSNDGCGLLSSGSSDDVVDSNPFYMGCYGRFTCFGVNEGC